MLRLLKNGIESVPKMQSLLETASMQKRMTMTSNQLPMQLQSSEKNFTQNQFATWKPSKTQEMEKRELVLLSVCAKISMRCCLLQILVIQSKTLQEKTLTPVMPLWRKSSLIRWLKILVLKKSTNKLSQP